MLSYALLFIGEFLAVVVGTYAGPSVDASSCTVSMGRSWHGGIPDFGLSILPALHRSAARPQQLCSGDLNLRLRVNRHITQLEVTKFT